MTQLAFSLADTTAPVIVFRRQEQDGATTSFEISAERFRQLASWDPDASATPPLPVGDAIHASTSWLQRTNPRPEAKSYLFLGAAFLRFPTRTSNRWYYQVNFAPVVGDATVGNGLVTVIVLFDGSIVEPKR
jgi:hypothetical protein